MEPAALLENGNETHLCYSVPTLPERLLSALSNLKSVLKSFSVIFKPQNFLKLFSLFINFLKLLYPDFLIKVLLILSLPILALFIFFCYLYHRSITGVGLGCRFHLPRPANSIKNYNQIDSGFRLLEGTIFISLWDGGPFDRDAMEQNLVVKSSRVMRGNDLKTKLGPGGNTKIRIFDAGFIASFKRVVSKPLSSARLIAEALRNGVSWRLKVLHITWTRVKEAVCSSVESRLEALCTGIKSILKAFFTGATRYLITLIVDSLLQAYLSLRLLQALCIWTYKEQNITLRWYVEGWCAAFRSIRKIISTRYGDLALRPRITRKYIQCRRKIGRKLASASSSLRSIINSTIWIITLCYQNRTAIIMFLPTCIGMLLLWGMQASKHMGRFLLFDRVGQFIASLLVVMIGLLIWYRINPLNWFQLPGPQSYVDTRKFRPKASMEFLRPPRRRENRVRNER